MRSCLDCHSGSDWASSAVTTMSGLLPRVVRADACCMDVFASARYSLMELAMLRAVEALAFASSRVCGGRVPPENWAIARPTPRWATADTSSAKRPTAWEDWVSVGGGPGLGAVESR